MLTEVLGEHANNDDLVLTTVQREIENLETRRNPDAQSRADHIRRKLTNNNTIRVLIIFSP